MQIHGDKPIDPASRKRQLDAARGQQVPSPPATGRPDAAFAAGDSAAVARLVGILQSMNPSDLQRIEDLKERIADGRYRADPEELADLLLGRQR
jgi:anti-sigma28 factor (negative regulator of flagellin synthesis)